MSRKILKILYLHFKGIFLENFLNEFLKESGRFVEEISGENLESIPSISDGVRGVITKKFLETNI